MWPSIHHVARRLTLIGLVAGAAALVSVIAWTSLLRLMWDPVHGFPEFVSRPEGFHLRGIWTISLHPDHALGAAIAGVLAVAGIAFAAFIWRRRRPALLVAGLGSLATIAVPWLGRAHVVYLETLASGRYWATTRSPYVAAATDLAIGASLFLVLLALVAIVAFATERHTARAAAPGMDDYDRAKRTL